MNKDTIMTTEGNPLLMGETAARILAARIGRPVADATELALVGPQQRADKMLLMDDSQQLWQWVAASTAATSSACVASADSPTTGRWLLSPAGASGKVATTRTITATSPIQIDGTTSADLSANRTISILDTYLHGHWKTAAAQTAPFTAAIDTLYAYVVSTAAWAITFPAISSNDGHRIGVFNNGTTAAILTPNGNDAIGGTAASAATAAGPAAGVLTIYTANAATGRWLPK